MQLINCIALIYVSRFPVTLSSFFHVARKRRILSPAAGLGRINLKINQFPRSIYYWYIALIWPQLVSAAGTTIPQSQLKFGFTYMIEPFPISFWE